MLKEDVLLDKNQKLQEKCDICGVRMTKSNLKALMVWTEPPYITGWICGSCEKNNVVEAEKYKHAKMIEAINKGIVKYPGDAEFEKMGILIEEFAREFYKRRFEVQLGGFDEIYYDEWLMRFRNGRFREHMYGENKEIYEQLMNEYMGRY